MFTKSTKAPTFKSSKSGPTPAPAPPDVVCFYGSSMVAMADGSSKRLAEIEEGDMVKTGTGMGLGRVTDKVVHPWFRVDQLLSHPTHHGVLLGVPKHPVLKDGKWIEFADYASSDLLSSRVEMHVDYLYDLEIDGGMTDSSHSYVLNGVVVAGFGRHEVSAEVMNMLHPVSPQSVEQTTE